MKHPILTTMIEFQASFPFQNHQDGFPILLANKNKNLIEQGIGDVREMPKIPVPAMVRNAADMLIP